MEIIVSAKSELKELLREVLREEHAALPPAQASPQDRIIDTKALCEILNVTEPTIIRMRAQKKIPYMMLGSSVRFSLNDVLKAIEKK